MSKPRRPMTEEQKAAALAKRNRNFSAKCIANWRREMGEAKSLDQAIDACRDFANMAENGRGGTGPGWAKKVEQQVELLGSSYWGPQSGPLGLYEADLAALERIVALGIIPPSMVMQVRNALHERFLAGIAAIGLPWWREAVATGNYLAVCGSFPAE